MKNVILAGIDLKKNNDDFESMIAETQALCEACGLQVVGTIFQRSNSPDPHTAFRKGKIGELKMMTEMLEADGIVFHNALGIQMAERIASITGVEVIDRTAVILDIFSMRARSRQAKLQVELARLQYDLPKVLGMKDTSGHERGGEATNRGAGEMRSAVIARKYQARITDLKKELKKIEKQKYQDERRRTKSMLKRVALIGYTNAGKSSLMNALLQKNVSAGTEVYEEDMLFATLDTSVRMVQVKGTAFLLYDTVGFVSDLPHELVEAFQSTLDAARDADLLLHVIDISDPEWQKKAMITEETLKQIHADDIDILRVYNKIDIRIDESVGNVLRVSCLTGEGIEVLSTALVERLYPQEETIECLVPYEKLADIHAYRQVVRIREKDHTDTGILMEVSGIREYVNAFRRFRTAGHPKGA